MKPSLITQGRLRAFKLECTDENIQISSILSSFLSDTPPGLVVDVGAGLGDLAERAYPDRDVVLIDILDFESCGNPRHVRFRGDFFDYRLPVGTECAVMLMSHVLQYIDDDVDRLVGKVEELAPLSLVTVVDSYDPYQEEILNWLARHGITTNPERPVVGFPPSSYKVIREVAFDGSITAPTYTQLADILSRMIFDSPTTQRQIAELSSYLRKELPEPNILIPQVATLYART